VPVSSYSWRVKQRERKRLAAVIEELRSASDEPDVLARLDLLRDAREALERLERSHAEAARDAGRTWAEIGELYGLSKQGAQQRFRRRSIAAGSTVR